jgi:hypothetical protein
MKPTPEKLTLEQWDERHRELVASGMSEPDYGGPLSRHVVTEGDLRLRHLLYDNSAAALRLWNFLLTENTRLRAARAAGDRLIGAMKDLGTVPVLAYSLPGVRAFYPDGAWWTPCLMECGDRLLQQAEQLGIDATFCPVRAMLAAFENQEHFPTPDLLICSTGATCDDFSAIAQRLERLQHSVLWWEIPRRRAPDPGERFCVLPGGLSAPQVQVECVCEELQHIVERLEMLTGLALNEPRMRAGIRAANEARRELMALRQAVYGAPGAPLPALEMLVAEMLAIHFCSDQAESVRVLKDLRMEAQARAESRAFVLSESAVRVFWVNPVADLRAMNLLESCGGRLCGSDFMFIHALDLIPEDLPPLEALARTAMADPMIGSASERASRVVSDCRAYNAEAVVIARIPGASHCPWESRQMAACIREQLDLPVVELEVPPVCDAMMQTLRTRLQALIETARCRRHQ